MDDTRWLTERFEADRAHLTGVAYRMLGSLSEADDAVQEAWIRLNRANTTAVENLSGWLTTVVARVCLDMLRSRKSRREAALEEATAATSVDPEEEALLAASVGPALLVVLETLGPAERLAFVLHDLFGVPFDEVGAMVGRSPAAARQLASRARRRVRGAAAPEDPDVARQRAVVEAFLAASRGGDLDALVAVLDPDVILTADSHTTPTGISTEVRGATMVATRARAGSRPGAQVALIDGSVGVVVAPRGRLQLVLCFTVVEHRIVAIDIVGDPDRLQRLDVAAFLDV